MPRAAVSSTILPTCRTMQMAAVERLCEVKSYLILFYSFVKYQRGRVGTPASDPSSVLGAPVADHQGTEYRILLGVYLWR